MTAPTLKPAGLGSRHRRAACGRLLAPTQSSPRRRPPQIWPDTRITSLSLRARRDVNADAQALADLASHASATSPAGIEAYVAVWSRLNHLK